MNNIDAVYNSLPVLQNGYTYFKLRELVNDLAIKEDTIAWYIDSPRNEIPYIRPVNLSCDYRNCDIDSHSITEAPYWKRSYQSSLNKFVNALEVYDTDNNNGGYAVFVDGHIKVGKMSNIILKLV